MIDLRYIESYVVSVSDGSVLGLHELLPAMAARHPDQDEGEVLGACQRACEKLVVNHFARLRHIGPGAERPTRDDYLPVEEARWVEILRDDRSYQTPRDARPRYFLSATETGAREYLSEEVVSL